MYITKEAFFNLDKIIKSFEVAFRSYIAEKIINQYSSVNKFIDELKKIKSKVNPSNVIYSKKLIGILENTIKNYTTYYNTLNKCCGSIVTKSYYDDVPYISKLIHYIVLFYNDVFSHDELSQIYSSIDEFIFTINLYNNLRNTLSHPASKRIKNEEANRVIYFIKRSTQALDDKYYWYINKPNIYKEIENYYNTNKNTWIINNLNKINFTHRKIICREQENKKIYECIIGNDEYKRVFGSLVIFGYGGVGKTALVLDFLYELISQNTDLNYDFILFFSSKDEYLRSNSTTGEFFIEKIENSITSFESLMESIKNYLGIISLENEKRKGIIVIDNIENLDPEEKNKILQYIKKIPRNVQFLITSRDEESCEEKIHLNEFKEIDKGTKFINSFIDSESLNIELTNRQIKDLIGASKGNTLILVQSLLSINEKAVSIDEIINSLNRLKTKRSEIIADFMYKNTFTDIIEELESKEFNPKEIIRVISLYNEPIELYSVSKLCKIDLDAAEVVCNTLSKRLILEKNGEYYTLNDFANSFIFIKLLPDKIEISDIKSKITNHKNRMKEKIDALNKQLANNSNVEQIMNDWKPRNYIDKIIIAECFDFYSEINNLVFKKKISAAIKLMKEYSENEMISNHPYIQFQKARLYKLIMRYLPHNEKIDIIKIVERSYEDAIEAIEYDYPYIRNSESHGALLMLFGIFLSQDKKDLNRAVKYLDEARVVFQSRKNKSFYITCNYLSLCYKKLFERTNNRAYFSRFKNIFLLIKKSEHKVKNREFDIHKYIRKYSWFVNKFTR